MTRLVLGVIALLGTPLYAVADTAALESIDVRCGEGQPSRCALQLEFTEPVHLGHCRFAIRSPADGDFTPARALSPDPERSTTVYLVLPEPSRGDYGVRWMMRSEDGQRLLRGGERTVRVK